MRGKIKAGLAALAALVVGGTIANKNIDLYDRHIPVELNTGRIEVPVYNTFTGLRFGLCSAYVRKASDEIFPENEAYSYSDAWERPQNDKLIAQIDSFSDIDSLLVEGSVTPGMVVGVRVPGSEYNDRGEFDFGHVMLLLGEDRYGEELYAHQWGAKTHVHSRTQLENYGFAPKVVVSPREN